MVSIVKHLEPVYEMKLTWAEYTAVREGLMQFLRDARDSNIPQDGSQIDKIEKICDIMKSAQ